MSEPISEDKKCPNCGSDKYVISVFGSICPVCLYDPKKDGEPNPTADTSKNKTPTAGEGLRATSATWQSGEPIIPDTSDIELVNQSSNKSKGGF